MSCQVLFRFFVENHCLECHDHDVQKGDVNFEKELLDQDFTQSYPHWEKAYRLILAQQMPPVGKDRPSKQAYKSISQTMVQSLDALCKTASTTGSSGFI